MQKNPIGWFDLPVADIDRAEKFYTEYFGFEFNRQEDQNGMRRSWFPMDEGYGAAGMLIQGDGFVPSHDGPTLYFTSPGESIDDGIAKAEALGITILIPKTDIGEHGFYAWLEDSEGNRIAIHSMKG